MKPNPEFVFVVSAISSLAATNCAAFSFSCARRSAVTIPTSEQSVEFPMDRTLRDGTEGENATPIRVFTIAYGKQADQDTLERIAQASNAAAYDASNPATIAKVFTAVLSNF